MKAFVVEQGGRVVLEHTLRDRRGRPVDVSPYFTTPEVEGSSSSSSSSSAAPGSVDGTVKLRIAEWGVDPRERRCVVWEVAGTEVDPTRGVVRAELPASAVEQSGIYTLGWAVTGADGRPVVQESAILSVERSLWPADLLTLYRAWGRRPSRRSACGSWTRRPTTPCCWTSSSTTTRS
jgi:hypothetical protein